MAEETRNWKFTRLSLEINDILMPAQSVDYVSEYTATPVDVLHAANAGYFDTPHRFSMNARLLQVGNEVGSLMGDLHGQKAYIKAAIIPRSDVAEEWGIDSIELSNAQIPRFEASGHGLGELPVVAISIVALRISVLKKGATEPITYGG